MTLTPSLDLFPLLAAVLAVATCGLLGNFLVLRRLSLMGDAISHSVLPGLVIAFLLTSARTGWAMLLGAAVAGVVTVVLIELVKKLGRVEPGAAMGVIFSILFAAGVLLIEQAAARNVDLDADCVLYGQLETLNEFRLPATWAGLLTVDGLRATLDLIPRAIVLLVAVFAAAVALCVLLFKELRISAFDPGLATTQGVNAALMHYLLMTFVAAATVAAFEAVGSILVIAMLIVPAVTARLLTDRLAPQLIVSLIAAVTSAVVGYLAASAVPAQFGAASVQASGSMTTVAGLLLVAVAFLSPSHGVLGRVIRRRRLGRQAATEDLLTRLLRTGERGQAGIEIRSLQPVPGLPSPTRTVADAERRGFVTRTNGTLSLTQRGERRAASLLRRHRLWETYLVDDVHLRPDHVHGVAERLEHLPVEPGGTATHDPHGQPIPPERTGD